MGQPVGQVAVVGQQQEAFAVGVEAADREHSRVRGDHVDDRRAAVGVSRSGDDPGRLVQQVMDEAGLGADRRAVDLDAVGRGVDPAPQFRDLAVDGDPALGDEILTGPAAGHAGGGENLLELVSRP